MEMDKVTSEPNPCDPAPFSPLGPGLLQARPVTSSLKTTIGKTEELVSHVNRTDIARIVTHEAHVLARGGPGLDLEMLPHPLPDVRGHRDRGAILANALNETATCEVTEQEGDPLPGGVPSGEQPCDPAARQLPTFCKPQDLEYLVLLVSDRPGGLHNATPIMKDR